jgi:hypothetical protein
MKKLISVVLVLGVLLSALTGCANVPVDFAEFDADKVRSVELCRADAQGFFTDPPVCTLEGELAKAFLLDLAMMTFTDFWLFVPIPTDPSFSYGEWMARINFDDGSSWQISDCSYNERFDAQGECIGCNHYDCDSAHWEMLIQNYIHSPMP